MGGNNNLEEKESLIFNALIKEECIEPYFIEITDNAFDVYKKVERTKEGTKEKFEDKEHVGCYINFRGCLKRIAFLKSYNKGSVVTIGKYIQQYDEILKRIELTIPEIKIN